VARPVDDFSTPATHSDCVPLRLPDDLWYRLLSFLCLHCLLLCRPCLLLAPPCPSMPPVACSRDPPCSVSNCTRPPANCFHHPLSRSLPFSFPVPSVPTASIAGHHLHREKERGKEGKRERGKEEKRKREKERKRERWRKSKEKWKCIRLHTVQVPPRACTYHC
jgi:hypothetical protein